MSNTITKKDIAAKLEELQALPGQDEEGQYEVGSEEQQSAALKVEILLTEGVTATASIDLVATALLAMQDIQVRDYAMGLVNSDNFDHYQRTFKWLAKVAPNSCKNAPTAILALSYYELGDNELALKTLEPIQNKNYSLAILLSRVFQSGWPVGAFAGMRAELHPKVTEGIFGKGEAIGNKE
jgi:uncharacterized protein YoaH (UPF0181 family)